MDHDWKTHDEEVWPLKRWGMLSFGVPSGDITPFGSSLFGFHPLVSIVGTLGTRKPQDILIPCQREYFWSALMLLGGVICYWAIYGSGVLCRDMPILGVDSFCLTLFWLFASWQHEHVFFFFFHLKQYFINIRINSGQLHVNYHIGPIFLSWDMSSPQDYHILTP